MISSRPLRRDREMMPWKRLAVLLLCSACWAATARAQQAAAAPAANLQGVLNRIHQHAADDAWRKPGFEDAQIEVWLDKLAGSIATSAKMPDLKVPVRLAEVQPADPAPGRTVSQRLLIGKNLDLKDVRLQNSIVLADGHVEINRAEGCVIMARGAVRLQASAYCVIVSGLYVEVSTYDGQPNDAFNGSIIATRGWVSLQSASGSIVAGLEGATVESAQDACIVNAAIARGDSNIGAKTLKVPDLPLEPLPANPLRARLKVVGIVRADTTPAVPVRPAFGGRGGGPAPVDLGIVVRYDGRRYLAAVGEPILDEAGRVVEPLREWKLALVSGSLAIFSSATGDIAVRLRGNP